MDRMPLTQSLSLAFNPLPNQIHSLLAANFDTLVPHSRR
uniref:Uncharacterized protein n=1 Tax=Arundo donax TaxID=35708 RepID=A0A0A8YTD7_ARUDO